MHKTSLEKEDNMEDKKVQSISQVAVVGSGIMGSGIAQVIAQAGYNVTIYDAYQNSLDKSFEQMKSNIQKWCDRTGKSKEAVSIMARLQKASSIEEISHVQLVIEAITEKLEAKQQLFSQLENLVDKHTILASNTSGISITKIAESCINKDRVVGTHFFNPAHKMALVEIISGDHTSLQTIDSVEEFIKSIGKDPVKVKDVPGFIVNRIITPMVNEAMLSYEHGYATKEDIDTALKKGMGHPMGPLELSDYIGLDTLLYFMDHVYEETGNEAYKPGELLRNMVRNGELGVKSGKGFYQYEKVKI